MEEIQKNLGEKLDKKKIDELFRILETKLIDMDYTEIIEVSNNIMQKMEEGDKDYFKSIIEEKEFSSKENYKLIGLYIVFFSSNKDYKEQILNNWEEYGFDISEITEIISNMEEIEDVETYQEYVKNFIEGKSKKSFSKIAGLIDSLDDIEYSKKCIENKEEFGITLGETEEGKRTELYEFIVNQLNSNKFKIDDIKKFIKEKVGLTNYDIRELFFQGKIDDIDFQKECIENDYGLNEDDIGYILEFCIKDLGYAKEYIEKSEEYGIEDSKLTSIIRATYRLMNTGQKLENFDKIVEFLKDKKCKLPREDIDPKEFLIKSSDEEFISQYWDKMSDEDKNKYSSSIILTLIKKGDADKTLFRILDEINKDIDKEKLLELLNLGGINSLKAGIIKNIFAESINNQNIDVNNINNQIEKLYQIFLTNTLPECFKVFQFFKNHENSNKTNENFYEKGDMAGRDSIIQRDLFRIALDSNNRQMRNFLEILHNGDEILQKKENLEEIDQAILLRYRDVLYDLLDVIEPNEIEKSENFLEDLKKLKEYLNIKKDENLGDIILSKYLEKIGLVYKNSDSSLSKSFLKYMDLKKEKGSKGEIKEFKLEEGDLIKGTDIEFLAEFLQNGIRSKEFFMNAELESDATPLDADFSEISEYDLQKKDFASIIDSTTTARKFGNTYLVIKKEDYDEKKSSTPGSGESGKTRNLRTGIGATNIAAIMTREWNDKYKYILAEQEFYIPVIDVDTGKILFSYDEYSKIRESMDGLSYYGIDNFEIDNSSYSISIKEQAEILQKKTEGMAPTEKKREKILEYIRKNIGKKISTEMIGDISGRILELIDIGSTRKRD